MSADGPEYLLPEGLDLTAATAMLAELLALEASPPRRIARTFYDTFDGRLHARGLLLVHEDRRLILSGAGAADVSAEQPRRPARFLASDLPIGPLRALLDRIAGARAFLPTTRVSGSVRALRVLNDDEKTVVRLSVEAPALDRGGNGRTALAPRLRVGPVRGYAKPLARVRRALERDLGLHPAGESLHDEALRASGGRPGGTSSKLDVSLAPDQRADSAAAALLTRLVATIDHNLPGTVADVDVEFLHDLRIAVRRTRAATRQLQGVFPPGPLQHFRAEFRWLQQVTGVTRDLDVQLLELGALADALPDQAREDLLPLRGLLEDRRRREQRRMVRALRSSRTELLLAGWRAFLDDLVTDDEPDRPHASRPIAEIAGRRIGRVHRRMVAEGVAIRDDTPAQALHDLRKTGKELRYLLEFFAGLYSAEVVRPLIKSLKALQDVLGRFQDREVQAAELRSLRTEVAALPDGPTALLAMGLVLERLGQDQARARAEFAERFAAFADRSQQRLVRRTFR